MRGKAVRGNYLDFGDYGIMALECGWITSRQIEAARIAMTRTIRRVGKVWIRIFPDKPYTKKPLEQRMGKGKAPVEGWVAVIKPGRIMFEMGGGVPEELAREALRLAMHKLPIRCKFVSTADFAEGPPLESGQEHVLAQVKIKEERRAKNSAMFVPPTKAVAVDEPAAGDAPADDATEVTAEAASTEEAPE